MSVRIRALGLRNRHSFKSLAGVCSGLVLGALLASAQTQPVLRLTHWDRGGHLAWTNALVPGICTVEVADQLNGKWTPGGNYYSTNSGGQATVPANGACQFVRLQSVDVGPTAQGFTNFVYAYGILETIAGNGAGQTDGVSYWQSYFEGWPGSWAALSRPHFAMADRAGAVYIADKNSHSILRLTPEGLIYTHAGTHAGGYNGEGPAMATNLQLNLPNSLWVRADGVVYALDTGNGRVRRVETNGIMSTLFLCTSDGSALSGGRGLWVKDDEMLAYFCAETRVRKWTPAGGLSTLASGFSELGDLYVEASGDVLVCDRKGNAVYRVTPGGKKTIIAGNGTANGGGDGYPALATGLEGVRGVWPVPTGGLLLLTHDSSRLWYMDTAGTVRLLLEGGPGRTHSGDGMFFYGPEPKISEGRSVTVDYAGNLLVCESDYGFVRRIRFQRVAP